MKPEIKVGFLYITNLLPEYEGQTYCIVDTLDSVKDFKYYSDAVDNCKIEDVNALLVEVVEMPGPYQAYIYFITLQKYGSIDTKCLQPLTKD